jgi:hypothetical protein
MRHAEVVVTSSQDMSVMLCCARADAPHLRPLVTHLQGKGVSTQLLEGVEDDPHLLGAALDRQRGACMFVACLSDTLGPKDFRRLTGVYNARKGPSHYLADIVVEPDEILVMAETIQSALTRANKAIASPDRSKRSNSRGPTRLRDVVGVTQISAVAEAPPQSARKPKPGEDKRAPLREQSVAGSYVISSRTGVGSPPPPNQPRTTPDSKSASASTTEGGITPEQSSVVAVIKPAHAGWVPVVLFLILVAVAGTAVLLLLQDQGGIEGIVGGRGVPRPAVIPGDTGSKPEATPPKPEPEPKPDKVEEPPAKPEPPVDEAAVIREAIASGELRSIDLVLVANPDAKANWRDASNLCRAKSFRGVRGWRLPSLEELKTIRGARMLDVDRYWSSTLAPQVGDGTDHVFVLDLEARTLDPVGKDAADVRVLCVRAALP